MDACVFGVLEVQAVHDPTFHVQRKDLHLPVPAFTVLVLRLPSHTVGTAVPDHSHPP